MEEEELKGDKSKNRKGKEARVFHLLKTFNCSLFINFAERLLNGMNGKMLRKGSLFALCSRVLFLKIKTNGVER
jgi:hypothetical protein